MLFANNTSPSQKKILYQRIHDSIQRMSDDLIQSQFFWLEHWGIILPQVEHLPFREAIIESVKSILHQSMLAPWELTFQHYTSMYE